MTLGSNKHPENVLTNIMVRMHMALELDVRAGTETYLKSQSKLDRSAVSLAADKTHGGRSTILTKKFMEQNKVSGDSSMYLDVLFVPALLYVLLYCIT